MKLLGDPEAPRHARWHAIWTLDAIDGGVAARAAVLDAVDDRDASVRAQAIRQLGTRRVAEARDRLARPARGRRCGRSLPGRDRAGPHRCGRGGAGPPGPARR